MNGSPVSHLPSRTE